MARDHDGNGIRSVGQAYRPGGLGIANASGQFAIGDSLAIGNVTEALPNFHLEGSALGGKREVEIFQVSCEIGSELADGLGQRISILAPCGVGVRLLSLAEEGDMAKAGVISCKYERAQGTCDLCVANHDDLVASWPNIIRFT